MRSRILLLLAVAALMTLMVVAPASAQVSGPLIGTGDIGSGNTVGPLTGDGDQPLSHTLEDVTVQCVADPLLDTGGGGGIVPIGDSGDRCADDGGTVEDGGGGLFP